MISSSIKNKLEKVTTGTPSFRNMSLSCIYYSIFVLCIIMSFSALIPVILCYIISLVFSRLNPACFSILKSEMSPEHKGVRVVRSPLQGKFS
jgi:uncharacterized membrane protein